MIALRTTLAAALVAVIAAPLVAADKNPFVDYIKVRYPHVSKVSVATLLADAARDGMIRGQRDITLAKTALRGLQRKFALGTRAILPLAPEREFNDSGAWADPLVAGTNANGDVAAAGEVDCYRLIVSGDSLVTLQTAPGVVNPCPDTTMLITSENGAFVYFNDDSNQTLYSFASLTMPAGNYLVHIAGFFTAAGSYTLTTTATAAVIQAIAPNTPLNDAINVVDEIKTYRLPIAAAAQIALTCNGTGQMDLFCGLRTLQLADFVFFDDSTSGGFNPALNTSLPAGTFAIMLGDNAGQTGSFTLTVNQTAGPVPVLPCASSTVVNSNGDEDQPIFLATSAGAAFDIQTAGGGTAPSTDTMLALHDIDGNSMMFLDDTNTSLFSRIRPELPAGQFLVLVRNYYSGQGGIQVSATCNGVFNPPTLANGRNTGQSIGLDGQLKAARYVVQTPIPCQVFVDASPGLQDSVLSVVDSTGRVVIANDDTNSSFDSFGGAVLPIGTYTVLVREYAAGAGAYDVVMQPPLFIDPRGAGAQLNSIDKAGQLLVLLASNTNGPGIPVSGAISGVFLLNPSLIIAVTSAVVPASGQLNWGLPVAGFAGVLQVLSLDLTTVTGTLTNLER